MNTPFDVFVIGGGHAGVEAAAIAARMGARTALLTQNPAHIGEMSCNPSIGGIGKSHLVREVDAFDGLMARAADMSCIHNKLLNSSKGPAVRGIRVQVDRALYRSGIQALLRATDGLTILEGEADSLVLDRSGTVKAVRTRDGTTHPCGSVVVATGTFLRGVVHIGRAQTPAGRLGEAPSISLAECLSALGLAVGRLKTGTPPRLERASIDWSGLPADWGDEQAGHLSFMTASIDTKQIDCRITGTTPATHALVRANLQATAVYAGAITGPGPRYCPSIEDKVVRFADRTRHQIVLEPEGLPGTLHGDSVYPNGISTSLPPALQQDMLRTIPGLERARISRSGYAIEYDFVQPTALLPTLEVRSLPGLFLAGQINGTTGYEEAAGQGVLAGLNAALRAGRGSPVVLARHQSYIGVMVDDLVHRGVSEPYRMFTSRAEYRLQLRCDNASLRLSPLAIAHGCVSQKRIDKFSRFSGDVEHALERARAEQMSSTQVAALGLSVKQDGRCRSVLDLCQAGVEQDYLIAAFPWIATLSAAVWEQVEVEALYGGYIRRQASDIRQLEAAKRSAIPADMNYDRVLGLSSEARQQLSTHRPDTIAALTGMAGLTPAAMMIVAGHLRRG